MSNYPHQAGPPQGQPWEYPPRPPGMGTGTKVLIGLGIGCGFFLLLCCGGLVAVGVYFQQYVKTAINEDPQKALAMTDQLVDIEVPEPLEPRLSLDFKMPVAGFPIAKGVVYTVPNDGAVLTLIEFGEVVPPAQRPEMRRQIEQSLREEGVFENEQGWTWQSQVLRYRIGDREVPFRYETAQNPETGHQHVRVAGTFTGKSPGVVMLFLFADTEVLSEDKVLEILDSLGEPLDEPSDDPSGSENADDAQPGEPSAPGDQAEPNPPEEPKRIAPPADAEPISHRADARSSLPSSPAVAKLA
jgi:hypothetical protein